MHLMLPCRERLFFAVALATLFTAGVAAQQAAQTPAQRARQDQADATELESEATIAQGLPGEASAAIFARSRAQQLRQEAAELTAALKSEPPPHPPGPVPETTPVKPPPPHTIVDPVQPPAATVSPSNLVWGPWDPVATCSGVDVHFSLAIAADGGQIYRIHLLNHNSSAAVVSFHTMFMGRDGERQPPAGLTAVTVEASRDAMIPGETIPFAVAEYGLTDLTVQTGSTAAGVAAMSQGCSPRLKRVSQADKGGQR